jgi:hypothetical protein
MLRRVALVRNDASVESSASNITVTRIGEQGKLLAFLSSPILVTLTMEALRSSVTSVLTSATLRNIPEDGILHSHRRGIIKSYIALTGWSLYRRRNMSPVNYELGFYIPEDDILHSHRRENLKSYISLTG